MSASERKESWEVKDLSRKLSEKKRKEEIGRGTGHNVEGGNVGEGAR